jgi:hypothetical protein
MQGSVQTRHDLFDKTTRRLERTAVGNIWKKH